MATISAQIHLDFISPPSGRDRLDDADRVELGAFRGERRVPARGRVEDEEADLVLGNVDRSVEADARLLPRQLLGGRAGPPLAGGGLSRAAAGEVGLDEVAGHASTLGPAARRKRQNV